MVEDAATCHIDIHTQDCVIAGRKAERKTWLEPPLSCTSRIVKLETYLPKDWLVGGTREKLGKLPAALQDGVNTAPPRPYRLSGKRACLVKGVTAADLRLLVRL